MIKKFISKEKIQNRNISLGKEISKNYKNKNLIIISILKGSFIFASDLIRYLKIPIQIDFMEVSTYGDSKKSTGKMEIKKDVSIDINNKDVLIIEDIIDTGFTLEKIIEILKIKNPSSIEICSLLVKKEKHQLKFPIKYFGFEIKDEFVVGYGMDYKGIYRNLDYIGILKE